MSYIQKNQQEPCLNKLL